MFFIDHSAKTTSFIDPRLPNDLPLLPADSAPPYLLLPNDPNATLLPPPPPRHHGASLTPPPTSRISSTQFDMSSFNNIDNQQNQPLVINANASSQHLMPPSQLDHGTGQNGNSRRRSRSVGEEEITRENIEAVSAATAVNVSGTRASSTSSHNMAPPTSPPTRGETAIGRTPPTIQCAPPQLPPSTYNGRVVAYLRQPNIIDILKEKSTTIVAQKSLRDKVNMIRQEGCHALERLSCDVELIMLLRYL